ncbi:MAG: site-specific integrase [Eggerthellaceae bacterium]|nr:site-specific integrase [Eggerthellaceae bacterium]
MIPVSAKHISGDTWEVSLPRVKSAVKHKDSIRPRRRIHAADRADAIRQGEELFEREYAMYKMGVTMNLADLAVYFIDHAEADGTYTPETARDYRGIVLRYVEPNFAKDADQVTAIDIERLYAHLLTDGGRNGDGINPNTVHKLNTVLRATYAFITRENPAISNPMPSVELPARVHPDKRALTDREFVKVLEGLESALGEEPSDAAGIKRRNMLFGAYLGIHMGARVGEVCAITRGGIRAIEHAARLDHSMSEKGGLHRKKPKTRSSRRTVAIDSAPWEMLRKHYEWQASYLTDKQRDSDGTPVCCKADGGFIAPSDMSAAFKGFCASVGVELADGESFHVLRHTHATQLLSNKANPKEVQQRLGHSRIETTFEYSHVMPGEDAATATEYGAIVERARKAGGFR